MNAAGGKHALPLRVRAVLLLTAGFVLLAAALWGPQLDSDRIIFSLSGGDFAVDDGATARVVDVTGRLVLYLDAAGSGGARLCVDRLYLPAGHYTVTVQYAAATDAALRIGCENFLQPDNAWGAVWLDETLSAAAESARAEFDVEQGVHDVAVTIQAGAGFAISHLDIVSSACTKDAPLCAVLAVLAFGAVLWGLLRKNAPCRPAVIGGEAVSGRRVWLALAFVFGALTAVFSLPVLGRGLYGGEDMSYALGHLEGMAAGLAAGQFPVRLNGDLLNGYGYPNSLFYPELLWYLPALLRTLGASLARSYRVMVVEINLLTLLCGYWGFSKLLGGRWAGLCAAVVYAAAPYRLVLLYQRSAIGECMAMIFLPVLIYGLYAVLCGDKRDWPWLCAGMSGVVQTHVLTTELAGILCCMAALLGLRALFGPEKRILPVLKAAALTVLLNLWFLAPLCITALRYPTAVFGRNPSYGGDNTLADLLSLPGLGDERGSLGPVALAGCLALALYLILRGGRGDDHRAKFAAGCLGLGGLCALAATDLFPWQRLFRAALVRRVLGVMHFSARYLSPAAALLTAAAAMGFVLWLGRGKWLRAAALVCAGVALLTGALQMQMIGENGGVVYRGNEDQLRLSLVTMECVGQGEYLMQGTSVADITLGAACVTSSGPELVISGLHRTGTRIRFDYRTSDPVEGQYLLLPLSYYPAYTAELDGARQPTQMDGNHQVRVELTAQSGHLEVYYRSPLLFRAFEAVSLLTLAAALVFCFSPAARNRVARVVGSVTRREKSA